MALSSRLERWETGCERILDATKDLFAADGFRGDVHCTHRALDRRGPRAAPLGPAKDRRRARRHPRGPGVDRGHEDSAAHHPGDPRVRHVT